MDTLQLPDAFTEAQRSLAPYIRHRQEATQIRRVLTSFLESHINLDKGVAVNRPLSLVDRICNSDGVPSGFRGLQKEYIRSVRDNLRARDEFTKLCREHHAGTEDSATQVLLHQDTISSSLESYIDLVKQRQKHDRLRVIQDYCDAMCQKPAASLEHLDPKMVLKDVETLPKVPSDVIGQPNTFQAAGAELKTLVDLLEKSVLRAKMLLKREQNLLAKVKAEGIKPFSGRPSRLQALGLTRNALINWIEGEMDKAGDGETEVDQNSQMRDERGKHYIDLHLEMIQKQYSRYIKARQSLIIASFTHLDRRTTLEAEQDSSPTIAENFSPSSCASILYPYLEDVTAIANEQKSIIQQKSHLSISLAKQLKEASQGLDRLAEESHLLPAYPMSNIPSKRNGVDTSVSFGDEISNHERPDSSRRALAWTFAAGAAGRNNEDAITAKLEQGSNAIDEVRGVLLEIQNLIGDGGLEADGSTKSVDTWSGLEGNLGVIDNL